MNTQILQKCVDELKKDSFSKEYVLGMLETIIAMNGVSVPTPSIYTAKVPTNKEVVEERNTILDMYEKGPIAELN